MTSDSVLPPLPRRPPSGPVLIASAEADFWAGLFLDLGVRIEWLTQALDALPTEDASAASVVRLHSYAQALQELHGALDRVQQHRADMALKPVFGLDGPLAGFLSRLYAWCEKIADDFERMARALRRRESTSIVFSHSAVDESYAEFDALFNAIRSADAAARERHGAADPEKWRSFTEHVEELIWATEWVHLALVRRPGD